MLNLNGSVLRVVTRLENVYTYDVEVEKMVLGNPDNNGSCTSYVLKGGFAASILLQLSSYLNFSYEIVIDSSPLTYRFDQVSNLSIDLFAASYSLTKQRTALVDPTFVIGSSKIKIFFNRAFEASLQDLILAPFHTEVWWLIGVLILVLCAAIAAVTKCTEMVSISDATFKMFATLIQRDGHFVFISLPARIILWTTSFTSILLFGAYSGTIVSISSVKKYFLNTFERVAASEFDMAFNYGYNNGSSIEAVAQALNNPTVTKVLTKMKHSAFRFESFENSFKEVERRPFAYVIDEETGFATIEKQRGYFPCDYASVTFANMEIPWVMYLQQDSPWKSAINYGLLKLRENGHLRYYVKHWLPGTKTRACGSSSGSSFLSVHLHHTKSAFVILIIATFAALAFLIAELIFYWSFSHKNNREIIDETKEERDDNVSIEDL